MQRLTPSLRARLLLPSLPRRALVVCVFLVGLFQAGPGHPQTLEQAVELDPRHDWQVLETAHFQVAFAPQDEPWARHVAKTAEKLYPRLARLTGGEPSTPVRIAVAGDHEVTNGFSVPFPYNQVQIFLPSPRPGTLLAETGGDWLRLLLAHELTHTFHLDRVHQVPLLLRYLVGRAPGLGTWGTLSPMWLVEGLATYSESQLSGEGRLQSPLALAILRQAALSGRFDPMDRAASFDELYPGGNIPYVYGAHFWEYLARRFGEEKIAAWINHYAEGPVPYAVDWSAYRSFGSTFGTLWKEWETEVRAEAQALKERIEAEGLKEGSLLLEGKGWVTAPRVTPEGKIVFWRSHPDHFRGAYELDPATGKADRLSPQPDVSEIVFDGGGRLYGTRSRKPDVFSRIEEIATAAGLGEESQSVPGSEHGREPAVSADGGLLVFVRRFGPHAYLAKLDLQAGAKEAVPLTPRDEGLDYADPTFLPASSGEPRLAASILEGGRWALWEISAATGKRLRRLSPEGSNAIQPAISKDGGSLAYASDRTGIYNLYLQDLATGREAQLTNVLGAALEPSFSADGRQVYFVSWEAGGEAIRSIGVPTGPLGNEARGSKPASQAAPSDNKEAALPQESAAPLEVEHHPYRPFATLVPRFWMPQVALANNDVLLGGWSASEDLLRHWFYSVSAFYGTTSREPRLFATVGYSRLPVEFLKSPLVFASFSRDLGSFGEAYLSTKKEFVQIFDQRQQVSAGISSGSPLTIGLLPLENDPGNGFFYSAGAYFERRQDLDGNLTLLAAENGVRGERLQNYSGSRTIGFFAKLNYTWTKTSPAAISPELGFRLTLEGNTFHKELGADFSGAVLSGDLRVFLPVPLLTHHVLALRVAGGSNMYERPLTPAFVLGGSLGDGLLVLSSTRLSLLRGYQESEFAGDHFFAGNAEYRLPLLRPRRGLRNLPVYLESASLVGFADAGEAWIDGNDPTTDDLALGVGGELVLTGSLGYFIPTALRVGVGRSLRLSKDTLFYVQLGRSF